MFGGMADLANIRDLPDTKALKFGPKFIECIKKFCVESNLPITAEPERGWVLICQFIFVGDPLGACLIVKLKYLSYVYN